MKNYKRTKIALAIFALLDSANIDTRACFLLLSKAEKKMSFKSVCELNADIFEAQDRANERALFFAQFQTSRKLA